MTLNEEYAYRSGMSPQTRTVISTKNKVYAKPSGQKNFLQIGVMASFDPSDSRGVDTVRGIGYGDQIAELVPSVSDPITISVTRSALYLSLLMQTFGYNAGVDGFVRALKHHRWPFDIKQEIVFSEIANKSVAGGKVVTSSEPSLKALLTYYEACWMTSYSWSFTSDTAIVQETCEISCSDIVDARTNYHKLALENADSGNNPYTGYGSARFGAPITPNIANAGTTPIGG